ncbi:hypothetical protein [Actinomadura parmotrematis]|uniref:DUF4232 domain-containing protein n=1 Tax=Actinomadura parmotrematis TaxID=2864039 RepID=A0ABS7FZF9_9ACTN|nr:hypothetical protein [Actinomadura parmotrematis]MBW8485004.1 hypothetical protein [Actinomadura parmotrematis]
MEEDTERDPDDLGFDQYWKRRAVALAAVLGVVGLGAYACVGGSGDDEQAPRRETVQNAAAVGAPSPAPPTLPAAAPTVTVTARVTKTAAAPRRAGDACAPDALVVNVASAREVYAADDRPQFALTVVNTGAKPCTFDVGSRALDLRISSGADRVWAASRCDAGTGTSIQMLRRGIPYAKTFTWDRRRAGEECRGDRPKARPGTYVAQLKGQGVKTKKQVFALR